MEMIAVNILPDSSDIYTYSGSATTPPCGQNVQWIIHRQPIILSETTVSHFNPYRNRSGRFYLILVQVPLTFESHKSSSSLF